MGHLTFLETDPAVLFQDLKKIFETYADRTLYPAQIENLLLKTLAYVDSERRIATQYAAEQNLVAYATGPHLDALGANLETPRLQPSKARCEITFTQPAPAAFSFTIQPGVIIKTADGRFAFETITQGHVVQGETTIEPVQAQCLENGAAANGIPTGMICDLGPALQGYAAANTTTPTGGGDLETDEAYRTRLLLTPARFGGGTADGYRLAALGASPEVADALAVPGAQPGDIQVYILARTSNGGTAASRDLCLAVAERLNKADVALIGDRVAVDPALDVPYSITADLILRAGHDRDLVRAKASVLAFEFGAAHSARLGIDVTPTQILLALAPLADAIYSIDLATLAPDINLPKGAPLVINPNQWARLTTVTFRYAGAVNE